MDLLLREDYLFPLEFLFLSDYSSIKSLGHIIAIVTLLWLLDLLTSQLCLRGLHQIEEVRQRCNFTGMRWTLL